MVIMRFPLRPTIILAIASLSFAAVIIPDTSSTSLSSRIIEKRKAEPESISVRGLSILGFDSSTTSSSSGLYSTSPLQTISDSSSNELSTSDTDSDDSESQSKHRIFVIVFSTLGALAALAVTLLCVRSMCSYCRTPKRDRAAEILHREAVERELEEMEEEQDIESHFSSRITLPLPPPPYERAPDYGDENKTRTL